MYILNLAIQFLYNQRRQAKPHFSVQMFVRMNYYRMENMYKYW